MSGPTTPKAWPVHHVGEQHRDLFVLRAGIGFFDWCTTAVTKPGVL